jgi:hypothetical protein
LGAAGPDHLAAGGRVLPPGPGGEAGQRGLGQAAQVGGAQRGQPTGKVDLAVALGALAPRPRPPAGEAAEQEEDRGRAEPEDDQQEQQRAEQAGVPEPGGQAGDAVVEDPEGQHGRHREPGHGDDAVERDEPALAVEHPPARRAPAQPAADPGEAAGAQLRNLQPVHQQVVPVEREEWAELKERVHVPEEGELEREPGQRRHGQATQLDQAGQEQRAAGAGRGHEQAGAAARHPDVGGVDEDGRNTEIDQQSGGRHLAPGGLGGQRPGQLVGDQHDAVEHDQHDRAQKIGVGGQEQRPAAAQPGGGEQHDAEDGEQAGDDERAGAEEEPAARAVEGRDQAVDVEDEHSAAARGGEHRVADPLGHRLAAGLLHRAERVHRELVEHPVAGQVGHHPADLVGSEPAGDPGELGDQPGHRAVPVHEQGELPLLGGETQVSGAGAGVGRAQHDVLVAAGGGELDGLDAGAQHGPGAHRVEPVDDGAPQAGIERAAGLSGSPSGQRFPDVHPGLDVGHLGGLSLVATDGGMESRRSAVANASPRRR